MQQILTLKQQGQLNPEPRKQLLADLQLVIQEYNKINEVTYILMDANDGLYNRQSLLPTFMQNNNHVPWISNPEMYPPTHNRGSQYIDFIVGSPQLVHYIEASGMTGFFEQPWPNKDHRNQNIFKKPRVQKMKYFETYIATKRLPIQALEANFDLVIAKTEHFFAK
jgi:hypothetical protein